MLDYVPQDYATVDEAKAGVPAPLLSEVDDVMLSRLLRFASGLIRDHTKFATYDTDSQHMPTSSALQQIFREATLAQITSWLENDLVEDVLSGGVTVDARLESTSSNGKSFSFDTSASGAAVAHLTSGGLGAEAEMILNSVGLLGGQPGVLR